MLLKQFRYDLVRGLGSIILYLKNSSVLTSKHMDAIYNACITNTAYDPQCESSREEYLWEIIQLSTASNTLQERILNAMEGGLEGWNLLQVYRLAKIFARNGNSSALTAMKNGFRYHADWNCFIGDEEIIEAEGEEGFLFVASQIGKEIISSDYYEDRALLVFAHECLGEDKANALLENSSDVNIQAYLRSVRQHKSPMQFADQLVSYEDLKASIQGGPRAIFRYTRWGKEASTEDLLMVTQDLLKENHSKKIEAYLYVFGKTAFPLDPQPIFELTQSKNLRLRSAAILALRNIKDERIHQLATQLIRQRISEIEALDLFILNYRESDIHLLEPVVFGKRRKDSFHDITFSIVKIFANNPSPRSQKILMEVYKKGLCTHCREHSVELMISTNILPPSIQGEIRYDCNSAIRNLVLL